jgi:acetolactate synthase-1/2/3 large subunit
MTSRAIASEVVHAFRAAGIELMFGVPGGGSNLEVVGAAEEAGIRFVLTHGETAAVIMAGVCAELTGTPGACVVTRGPGAASAVNGAAQALLDRQPVVIVSDRVGETERARVSHQRLDHATLFAAVTKASLVVDRSSPGAVTAGALALAVSGRPGPVHLDIDPTAVEATPVPLQPQADADADLAAVRHALRAARRPLVVAGVGALRPHISGALRQFLAGTGVPVLTTYKAKGVVDDASPNAAGLVTGATIEAPLLDAADLILGVGLDPVELIPAPWPYAAPVALIGGWPTDDSTYFGSRVIAEVVGDVARGLAELARDLRSDWDGSEARRERVRALDRVRRAVPQHPVAAVPQAVVASVRAAAPSGTIATVDAGAHMLAALPLWDAAAPGDLLVSSGLATMGYSLPAAVAAALVRPGRRVVCLTGDGGLGMVLAELELLARLQLDVTVVVFNDAALSLIAIKQRLSGQGGQSAVRYSPTDFSVVAAALGIPSWRARAGDGDSLTAVLSAALDRRGPALIDVAVDPSAYRELLATIRGPATS